VEEVLVRDIIASILFVVVIVMLMLSANFFITESYNNAELREKFCIEISVLFFISMLLALGMCFAGDK